MSETLPRAILTTLCLVGLAACGAPETASKSGIEIAQATDPAAMLSLSCSGCHSDQSGAIVSLRSHTQATLREALMQYKSDPAGTTVMHRLARGYTDTEIQLISAHLSAPGEAP